MPSFITRQPGKLLFTLWTLSINAARLPFWLVYYIPSFLRPNPQWTYKQALMVRILKEFLGFLSDTEVKTHLKLEPGSEGDAFIIINPGSSAKYVGVVTQDEEIKPQMIGATWYPSRPSSPSAIGRVVLLLHGGAYVIGDGRRGDAGFAAKTILEQTPITYVLAPQYRLASNSGGRFPAALQDAVTALLYLTDTLGIPEENITTSGDSGGGNLCLALLRYIHDNPGVGLPNPRCAWLWSPWINPADALVPKIFAQNPHVPTDYIKESFGIWGATAITPSKASGITLAHPNICFLGSAFASPTPLYFSIGECELLYFDVMKAYEGFKAVPGNKVKLEIQKAAVHDIFLAGQLTGFEKEARLAVKRAGEFLEEL